MKSIFITGIAGLLGSNIAYLLRDRYNISGIDRNAIDVKGVKSVVGNVQDVDLVTQLMEDNHADVLIHCAALVNLELCEEKPEEGWAMNYTLTKELSDFCAAKGIKMIFISTDAVFDGEKKGLNTEEDPVAPISMYGKAKAGAEAKVLEASRNLVVRTNIYGYNLRNKSSFGEWVLHTLESGFELNMFEDVFFSPILVNDLTDIMDKCIQNDVSGLYHVCGTGSISKYDIGLCFRSVFGMTGTINKATMAAFKFIAPRTHNMGMDNSLIKERLGIEIRTPEESVKHFKELMETGYPAKLKRGGYDE